MIKYFLLAVLAAVIVMLVGCGDYPPDYEPPTLQEQIESYEHVLDDGTRCVIITFGYTDGVGTDCDFE